MDRCQETIKDVIFDGVALGPVASMSLCRYNEPMNDPFAENDGCRHWCASPFDEVWIDLVLSDIILIIDKWLGREGTLAWTWNGERASVSGAMITAIGPGGKMSIHATEKTPAHATPS